MASAWRGAVAAVALGTLLLAACGDPPPEPDARFVSTALVKGFDPIDSGDVYSSGAQQQIYEGLLDYHYLKRPVELVPGLAESMPEISEDGLTYTFRLRDDLVFQDAPCFPGGKGRRVTAQDFVWCWKRLMGVPSSTGSWLIEEKITGLDDWAARCKERIKTVYDRVDEYYPFEHPDMAGVVAEDVEGLRALDERTLQVTLVEPFPQFLWTLAMVYTCVYPHEAVEHYGIDFRNHPVGTGPYRVNEYWPFDRKILFQRNPTFRGQTYPTEGAEGDVENGNLDAAGRPIPFLDTVEFIMIEDSQPRWLKFITGRLERIETEKEIWAEAMTDQGTLRADLAEMGIRVNVDTKSDIAYTGFNMDDPLIGEPAGERGRKLRQAMSLAYDQARWIKVMRNGFWATPADGPVPPTAVGHVDVPSAYSGRDLEKARRLMAEAGYPGGNGLPPLRYEMSGSSTLSRYGSEILKDSLKDIGIKVELTANTWDQFMDKIRKKNAQMYGMAWLADYPDAQNFLQLFYGPYESPGSNNSNYKNPEYDALYDQMKVMLPGPERREIIRKMVAIVNEDCPWSYTDYRIQYTYTHGWLRNFKFNEFRMWDFRYYDIDRDEKERRLGTGSPR